MKHINRFILMICFLFTSSILSGQSELLQSGPMLGYSEMQEVLIWVQTCQEAKVFIEYSLPDNSKIKHRTNEVTTSRSEAFTAKLIADQVEAGKTYSYKLFINEIEIFIPYPTLFQTQEMWKWRGDPPEFTMLTGSCAYINQTEHDRPGKPYGGDYRIFENMGKQNADFMLWLGDNIYLREPDWNTWTGIKHRYTHGRSIAELQSFLASTHHYSIWDDHDYGPNDSDKGFFNKNSTLRAFELFWGNPTFGVGNIEGAITSFQWGDADFFLLDNRWYRDPDKLQKNNKSILGESQLQWLFDNLVTSTATFKIIAMGGQFLSTAGVYELYTANGFEKERQRIIDFIYQHQIKNVIFITGDVHFTELSALRAEGKPTIWDFTFSTMTAGPNPNGSEWENTLRIPGTVVTERNYGKIDFRGTYKNRKLIVSCYNTDNELKWEETIEQE